MSRLIHAISQWLTDPFGQKRLLRKHNNILNNMQETRTLAKVAIEHRLEGSTALDRAFLGNAKQRKVHNE